MLELAMRICTCCLFALAPALLLGVAFTAEADEAADRAALDAAKQAWVAAFNARDADAMAALTTRDIVLLAPNAAPVRGREAVRAVWRQAASTAKVHTTATTEETVIAGGFAWTMGSFTHTLPDGAVVSRGRFLEIWKRVDGQWKMHRDMFSSNAAAAKPKFAPVPRPSEPVLDSSGAN
jgi:ketosteroid isomerase-like protein